MDSLIILSFQMMPFCRREAEHVSYTLIKDDDAHCHSPPCPAQASLMVTVLPIPLYCVNCLLSAG